MQTQAPERSAHPQTDGHTQNVVRPDSGLLLSLKGLATRVNPDDTVLSEVGQSPKGDAA